MKNLNDFVEAWDKSGNIEDILSSGLSLPSAEDAQAYLASLPKDAQEKVRNSLTAAMTALSSRTGMLELEAESLKRQISQNRQSSNACLVYNNTPGKPRS